MPIVSVTKRIIHTSPSTFKHILPNSITIRDMKDIPCALAGLVEAAVPVFVAVVVLSVAVPVLR